MVSVEDCMCQSKGIPEVVTTEGLGSGMGQIVSERSEAGADPRGASSGHMATHERLHLSITVNPRVRTAYRVASGPGSDALGYPTGSLLILLDFFQTSLTVIAAWASSRVATGPGAQATSKLRGRRSTKLSAMIVRVYRTVSPGPTKPRKLLGTQ
jgi:hypothetical protein